MSGLLTREEWLKQYREKTPDPDFGDVSNPQDITPQEVYSVGTKVTVRITGPSVHVKDYSHSSLELEIVRQIKVGPDRRSQIVVGVVNSQEAWFPCDADSFVIKFFDPVYLNEEELSGHFACEWRDRVRIATAFCDAELAAYQAITELQGNLVPICYGKATLVIASEEREVRNAHEVHGILLQNLPVHSHVYGDGLTPEERMQFVDKADAILSEIHRLGVEHHDPAPRNFCIDSSGRMYLLDFETATLIDIDPEKAKNQSTIEQLNFETYARLYGFLPRDIDWKYQSVFKVCDLL
jgi:uncharacterized protein YodC (DUF2158 family)